MLHGAVFASLLLVAGAAPLVLIRGGAPASAPAGAPGDAPAAPETQADRVRKLKEDMYKKIGDAHDSDYVVERGPTVEPGVKEVAKPGVYGDIANDDGTPGVPPPPSSPGMPSVVADLNPTSQHKDKTTMSDDWRVEYGSHGPKGAHSPYQSRPFKGFR